MTDFGQRKRGLLKTGQTVLFETGDDGDLEKGIPKSYTLRTTGQHAGTTDITINAKTHALSNEAVSESVTGLMWARYVPDDDIGPDNNGKLFWDDAIGGNSEDIWELAAQANANSLGGYADWRVPNLNELEALRDFSTSNPVIDTTTFPSTPAALHWTSTTLFGDTTRGWAVDFINGYDSYYYKQTIKLNCRLVRGG